MEKVITIPALGDNYIYLYRYEQNNALVVDPGDADTVFSALEKYSLNLTHILATHHHFDHVGGIKELKRKTNCKIIGSDKNSISLIDCVVSDSGIIAICGTHIQVIATPGHTQGSVCYYVQPSKNRDAVLFTGDTLFIGGCGRPIECDASVMWDSLQKITALPDDTLIYPGHDYTEENYEFALTVEPDNNAVKKYLQMVQEWQKQGNPTVVPSTIGQERATNVFLRSDDPEVKAALNMPSALACEVFAELRRRKDVFG
jgi:hydroxyacylglutathione hydrolase